MILKHWQLDYSVINLNHLFEIKDEFTGKPLFEVRKTSTAIDFTKQFATITSGI